MCMCALRNTVNINNIEHYIPELRLSDQQQPFVSYLHIYEASELSPSFPLNIRLLSDEQGNERKGR